MYYIYNEFGERVGCTYERKEAIKRAKEINGNYIYSEFLDLPLF